MISKSKSHETDICLGGAIQPQTEHKVAIAGEDTW